MPSTSKSIQCNLGVTTYTITIPVEKGRLKAVSLSQIEGVSVPGELYAMVALAIEPASPTTILAPLCAGAFTVYQPLGWDGDLPLEPNFTIYARIKALADVVVKLAILTEAP